MLRHSPASSSLLVATCPAVLLLLLSATAVAAQARTVPSPVTAPPAEPLSNYEIHTGHTLTRDCGYTVPVRRASRTTRGRSGPATRGRQDGLPQDLWLFCDTINYDPAGHIDGAILGTDTAAQAPLSPGEVPQDLSEVPTPPSPPAFPNWNGPAPFLPLPAGLVQPGSSAPCTGSPGLYPASWITGVAAAPPGPPGPGQDVLITFGDYCVDTGNASTPFTDEGFGVVSYDPVTNQLGSPRTVFATSGGQNLPLAQQLSSPVFYGGHLYLFTSECTATYLGVCVAGGVYLARAPALAAADPGSYQYWTGSGWSPDYAEAGSLIPGATPLGISAGSYIATGHGLVLVAETDLGGGFQVWTAGAPTGPWRLLQTGRVPSTCSGGEFGCYALVGHPELSTHRNLLISYFDPAGLGHLHLAAFSWASAAGPVQAQPPARWSASQAAAPALPAAGWPPGILGLRCAARC